MCPSLACLQHLCYKVMWHTKRLHVVGRWRRRVHLHPSKVGAWLQVLMKNKLNLKLKSRAFYPSLLHHFFTRDFPCIEVSSALYQVLQMSLIRTELRESYAF